MIAFPQSWIHAFDAIVQDPGIVVVVGASNSGKTTWVKAAAEECTQRGRTPASPRESSAAGHARGEPPFRTGMRHYGDL